MKEVSQKKVKDFSTLSKSKREERKPRNKAIQVITVTIDEPDFQNGISNISILVRKGCKVLL